jgi:hypothetical protein
MFFFCSFFCCFFLLFLASIFFWALGQDDWISASSDNVKVKNEDEGEDLFSEMSMKERAKIERETVNVVAGRDKSQDRSEKNLTLDPKLSNLNPKP